jgi:glycopeptide antibiotics resistance protein
MYSARDGRLKQGTMHASLFVWCSWAFAIVLVGTLPLSNFVGHSHWDYVEWIPLRNWFRLPPRRIDLSVDVFTNILLFVPFGYLCPLVKSKRQSMAMVYTLGTAAILSISLELYQVFNHNRVASMTDVSCNVLGAAAGVALALKRQAPNLRRMT